MSRWISVEERLPPDNVYVLLLFARGGAYRQRYVIGMHASERLAKACGNDSRWWPSRARKFQVTHWMTLPEPPT